MYVILVGECEVVGQMTKNMFLPKHILLTLQKRCDNVSPVKPSYNNARLKYNKKSEIKNATSSQIVVV
jgi:hypothetical protein